MSSRKIRGVYKIMRHTVSLGDLATFDGSKSCKSNIILDRVFCFGT